MFLQLCPPLCDPVGCSSPGSSIHGIHQARILEWVAIPFPRVSPQPRDSKPGSPALQADFLPSELPGKPIHGTVTVDKPRQHIKKQRHYLSDKGLYNQSYGFSSSRIDVRAGP